MATLIQQNPWLRDPIFRERALQVAAASSSAVEGIRKPYSKGSEISGDQRKPRKPAGLRP